MWAANEDAVSAWESGCGKGLIDLKIIAHIFDFKFGISINRIK